MFIIGDILLFAVTSLVLSITCLSILLHVRARDTYTREFLLVLIPLCLQVCASSLINYIHRVYPPQLLAGKAYEIFCLWISLSSILMTTILLFTTSRYLISLLPATPKQRKIGEQIMMVIVLLFLVLSLFFIIGKSQGSWVVAMNLTFGYHLVFANVLMVIYGITSLVYYKKALGWEQENLLIGISASFLPLIVTFPLDMIFFRDHIFKLSFLTFVIFIVFLYTFISRRYFQEHEPPRPKGGVSKEVLTSMGISTREGEIIELLVEGKTNSEIAATLYISTNTVKTHIKNIYSKLEISSRIQLFALLRGKEEN
ncbi:MAG: helix-turn-helix domain-containing protein [Sphaerochaetaceae bacterium]|nr:helix-turn-helix transcriptional regulator [Sphaerochaetaceae bacterium]HHU88717.1 helix-turn-helix transcriptional regulator [Spirochaetales bacterium]